MALAEDLAHECGSFLRNADGGTETADKCLIVAVRSYISERLSAARYTHSLRTAQTAAVLCRRYGVNEQAGYLAGLAHDMCKETEDKALFELALRDKLPVSSLEHGKKNLLHGRAAAVLLSKDFGVSDAGILEAVRCHTFGTPGMGCLAKIVYVADKIEPGRPHSSPEYVRLCMDLELNALLLSVAEKNRDYLIKRNKAVAPETFDLIRFLKGEKNAEL